MDPLKGYRHPKLVEALQTCPGNEDQVNIAFQVYMDLCEDNPVINIMSINVGSWDTMTCVNQVSEPDHPFLLVASYNKHRLLKTNSNPDLHREQAEWSIAKTWRSVELHHCEALNIMFVSARRGEGQPREVFLPTDVTTTLSQEDIHTHFQHLVIGDKQTHSLTLAVCDFDSSTVYYKLSDMLIPPAPPDVTEVEKKRRQQHFQHRRQHLSAQAELFRMEREENSRAPGSEGTCNVQESS